MSQNLIIIFLLCVGVLLIIFYRSQKRFKDKMLCEFVRPNKQIIEKFVPVYVKYVIFDQGKYGIGQYIVNPKAVMTHWFTRGINKFFPYLIPKLIFRWDTPFPLDPETFEPAWLSPEALDAAWQEHNHIAFAKANAMQSGIKKSMLDKLLPILMIGLLVLIGYLVWSSSNALNQSLFDLQQQIKLLQIK